MEKRGIGHIEVILSFILFVGAVGFAVYYFVPTGARYGAISEDKVMDSIMENISTDVISYSIYVDGNLNGIAPYLGISLPSTEVPNNFNVIVSNLSGAVSMGATKTGSGVCVKTGYSDWPNRDFLYLKLSEDFVASDNLICDNYDTGYYQIASRDSEKVASQKRLLVLNKSYYSNYNSLKNYLGVKNSNDFEFIFVFVNGLTIEAHREIPAGLEVYSASKKIKVIKNNIIEYGDLMVKVW